MHTVTVVRHGVQGKYIHAVGTGILKVMAKMGISTLQSYKGAQIFEALGLGDDVIQTCFPGTSSRIGGLSLLGVGRSNMEAHLAAFDDQPSHGDDVQASAVPDPGEYKHRNNQDGSAEVHMNDPMAIAKLQQATKDNSYALYKEFSAANTALSRRCHLRGLLKFKEEATAIPLDEVESAANIVRRFCTGAMSYGSISLEAHTSLAKVSLRTVAVLAHTLPF